MARKVTGSDRAWLRQTLTRVASPSPEDTLSQAEQARASRLVCALVAERYPGRDVELRVPPFAAVQLGSGERGAHTRGTPPNVVETDAVTLLRLASGVLAWPDATGAHLVRASGTRSDLARLWPLRD